MIHLHERFLVAMSVEKQFSGKQTRLIFGSVKLKEFAEQKSLLSQLLRARLFGHQIEKLVAKNRGTTWLQNDQAPVPDDGYITTAPLVWNTARIFCKTSAASVANSVPR